MKITPENTGSRARLNDFDYWHVHTPASNQDLESVDNDERSLALSVSLLLKYQNTTHTDDDQLSSHVLPSSHCRCQRSFHLFCTDLFPEDDPELEMITIHPAPRNHERDPRRAALSSTVHRKPRTPRQLEEHTQEAMVTTRSEPAHLTMADSVALEKKLPIPLRMTTRATSLNIPSVSTPMPSTSNALPIPRTFPAPFKSFSTRRAPKPGKSFGQLQIRALSIFEQAPTTTSTTVTSQVSPLPRGPPPSPKTPTQDLSIVSPSSLAFGPLRAIPIIPRTKYHIDHDSSPLERPIPKTHDYQDHAREYLSASDCSDSEHDEETHPEKKRVKQPPTAVKPKPTVRTQSFARPDTATRDRVFAYHPNHYLSLAEVYYSSLDIYKNIAHRSRRRLRSQTRMALPNNENEDASTTGSKSNTGAAVTNNSEKTSSSSQSKSVFGFAKTASSMHFGHAAGRLGLQSSFERWPQPLSRRTPIERKQEVTTLRLVTLPMVTS